MCGMEYPVRMEWAGRMICTYCLEPLFGGDDGLVLRDDEYDEYDELLSLGEISRCDVCQTGCALGEWGGSMICTDCLVSRLGG